MKKILLALVLIAFAINFGSAQQKFGYINSAQVLSKVPEVAIADSMAKKYQDSLTASMQVIVAAFQKKVNDYQAEVQKGNMAPIAQQKKEEELQKEQEKLRSLDAELRQKFSDRREALYSPILDKIDKIVKKIGKDNHYTMIFDSSQPGYLYLSDSDDLAPMVLKELGLVK